MTVEHVRVYLQAADEALAHLPRDYEVGQDVPYDDDWMRDARYALGVATRSLTRPYAEAINAREQAHRV